MSKLSELLDQAMHHDDDDAFMEYYRLRLTQQDDLLASDKAFLEYINKQNNFKHCSTRLLFTANHVIYHYREFLEPYGFNVKLLIKHLNEAKKENFGVRLFLFEFNNYLKRENSSFHRLQITPQEKTTFQKEITQQANSGDACAQTCKGLICESLNQDKQALRWYNKAAKQQEVTAMNRLGWKQYLSFERNAHRKGTEWFKQAAKQGYMPSIDELAIAYIQGRGITQSLPEAIRLFRLCAALGNTSKYAESLYQYGRQFQYGAPYPSPNLIQKKPLLSMRQHPSIPVAFTFYYFAAKLGHEGAKNDLKEMYNNGLYVEKNPDKNLDDVLEPKNPKDATLIWFKVHLCLTTDPKILKEFIAHLICLLTIGDITECIEQAKTDYLKSLKFRNAGAATQINQLTISKSETTKKAPLYYLYTVVNSNTTDAFKHRFIIHLIKKITSIDVACDNSQALVNGLKAGIDYYCKGLFNITRNCRGLAQIIRQEPIQTSNREKISLPPEVQVYIGMFFTTTSHFPETVRQRAAEKGIERRGHPIKKSWRTFFTSNGTKGKQPEDIIISSDKVFGSKYLDYVLNGPSSR